MYPRDNFGRGGSKKREPYPLPTPTLFCWSVDHDINCPVNFSGLRKNLRTESEIFGERRFSLFFTDWGTPARTNLSNLTIYNIVLLKELYWGQGAVLPAGSNIYFQACTIRFKCTQSYCHRQTFWEFQWTLHCNVNNRMRTALDYYRSRHGRSAPSTYNLFLGLKVNTVILMQIFRGMCVKAEGWVPSKM